jgi:hypothetical protein
MSDQKVAPPIRGDWYLVSSGSDGAMCLLVTWPNLRDAIHEVFCCCKDPAHCDDGYLADWDDYCEEQQREGAHWDLEDGWVKVDLLHAVPVFWPEPQPAHAPAAADHIARLAQENRQLREEIGGFPHVTALREAMIATADENADLKAKVARLEAPVSFREIEALEGVARSLPEASRNSTVAELCTKIINARGATEMGEV